MDKRLCREIVTILMSSRFYFDLSLKERHALVKYIMKSSSLSPETLVANASRFVEISPPGHA
jgi:hypothetical protein